MRKLLSVIIVYLVGWIPMFPCTSAVVSGRVTPDGRPLLWKHRDASDLIIVSFISKQKEESWNLSDL